MNRSFYFAGNKVCGKGGLVETDSLKASKREEIDFDSLRKDLHPDQYNSTQVISEKPPGPTQVISKVSNKRLWFERLNRCCMDHEDCNRFIPAKQERYNYRNDREYTVYDCKCDDSFAECLKYADSYTADAVGDLYFNVLKMPCINFSEDGNGTTAVDTSKNILDKVNEILAKNPGKKITKDGKEIVATLEGLQDMKEGGKPGPVSLRKLDDQSDAKERQARHFNRNGHQ